MSHVICPAALSTSAVDNGMESTARTAQPPKLRRAHHYDHHPYLHHCCGSIACSCISRWFRCWGWLTGTHRGCPSSRPTSTVAATLTAAGKESASLQHTRTHHCHGSDPQQRSTSNACFGPRSIEWQVSQSRQRVHLGAVSQGAVSSFPCQPQPQPQGIAVRPDRPLPHARPAASCCLPLPGWGSAPQCSQVWRSRSCSRWPAETTP